MLLLELEQEICSNLKGVLAWELVNKGLSQHRVSSFLAISQPMVNKLLKTPKAIYFDKLVKLGLSEDEITHYVNVLVDIVMRNEKQRFFIVSHSIVNILAMEIACKKVEGLREFCDSEGLRDPEIVYYRAHLDKILRIPGLARAIPEVGSNLVYSPRAPRSIADIIGLTGRIVKAGGRVIAIGEPMYGGSKHLSRALLLIASGNPAMKIGFVIAFREDILLSLSRLGLKVAYTGPHESEESLWDQIAKAASDLKPDVIADRGGKGLEPVIYLFSKSFDDIELTLEKALA